jgi:hypothetical protein
MDFEDVAMWVAGFFLIVVAVLLIFALFWGLFVELPVTYRTQMQCVHAGYPDYEVVWFLDAYCVTWEDATKIIVPLEEALK